MHGNRTCASIFQNDFSANKKGGAVAGQNYVYMYIYIKSVAYRERERERKRGLVFEEISPLEANKYRPFRWPKVEVGRGSRSRDKGDGGQKRPGDRDRPRSGLGMGKVRGRRDTAGIP